jgi:dual specificity tyrosine-phosphorylation-regulated kinase 2/3/4
LVNNGFDDEEGYYRLKAGDQIGYRYEIKKQDTPKNNPKDDSQSKSQNKIEIGKGAFGSVIKCYDHKTQTEVAIKMVKNQKKYYYQAAVEAKLLLLLKENDTENVERVVKLIDYFVWRNHLCLVFDLYSINLYEFIKEYDYQGFKDDLIRRFAI